MLDHYRGAFGQAGCNLSLQQTRCGTRFRICSNLLSHRKHVAFDQEHYSLQPTLTTQMRVMCMRYVTSALSCTPDCAGSIGFRSTSWGRPSRRATPAKMARRASSLGPGTRRSSRRWAARTSPSSTASLGLPTHRRPATHENPLSDSSQATSKYMYKGIYLYFGNSWSCGARFLRFGTVTLNRTTLSSRRVCAYVLVQRCLTSLQHSCHHRERDQSSAGKKL